jgi:hypothetical protein
MNQSVTERDIKRPARPLDRKVLSTIEICLAIALSAAWIAFDIRFFLHAGALWRDEVNSVNLSNSPTIANIWQNLQDDSFPMLWFLVLRFWIHVGIGTTDRGLRVLGLLVGLGILTVLWINARKFRFRPPIIALALLGFSSAFICYGGSIRAYGLGPLLELLTFGLMWDVATRPTPLRVIGALLIALAAVHMLYYNCVILAAICCGAVAVTAFHRQWVRAGIVLAIGVICAASMMIYAPAIHRVDIFRPMLVKEPSLTWILIKFGQAVSYDAGNNPVTSGFNLVMWELTGLFAFFAGAAALLSKRRLADGSLGKDLVIYHFTILCAGVIGYCWFLWRLSYFMQPWYYLALLALIAVCADGLIASFRSDFLRVLVCIAVVGFCLTTARLVWFDAGLRKTAMDSDARELQRLSKKGDLILVSPWYYGVGFERYFHGPADYVTVPPISFLSYHKYDLLIPSMQNTRAMDSTITRAANVLKSGHVVFLFGEFLYPSNDFIYPTIDGPAPQNSFGWNDGQYYDLWQRQVVYVLARHSGQTVPVATDSAGVSYYERPWLFAMRGWIDTPKPLADSIKKK